MTIEALINLYKEQLKDIEMCIDEESPLSPDFYYRMEGMKDKLEEVISDLKEIER